MPETRTRILDAAARAFALKGFYRATVRQIAAEAKVNEVTVFRYFPEKNDLYWAALDRKIRATGLPERLKAVLQGSGSPADLVFSVSECLFRVLQEDGQLARLLQFTFLELDAERRRLWDAQLRPLLDAVKARIREWIQEGTIREVDPESATRALLGYVISQHVVGALDNTDEPISAEKCAAVHTDLSLFGLLPR